MGEAGQGRGQLWGARPRSGTLGAVGEEMWAGAHRRLLLPQLPAPRLPLHPRTSRVPAGSLQQGGTGTAPSSASGFQGRRGQRPPPWSGWS